MQNALVKVETTERALGPLSQIADAARDFMYQSKAANTMRAYHSGWKHFANWCGSHRLIPMPAAPETIALYLADLAATCKTATLTVRLSALNHAHELAGHESPTHAFTVRSCMSGIRRSKGVAPQTKTAALTEDIRSMIAATPDTPKGSRDRALLLVGFAGAFRRSELVGLNYEDLGFTGEGLIITLRRSKTDQEGEGRKIGIPYGANPVTCPVRTLQAWLEVSGIAAGPLFRAVTAGGRVGPRRLCDRVVALTVKRYAGASGLDASHFAGHSLRAGLATQAAIAGVSERSIMNQTGHRSVNMLRHYIRDGSLFRDNAAAKIGL